MKSRILALASVVALAIVSGAAFAQGRDGGGWHGGGGGWHGGGGGWHGGGWRGGWYGPAIGFSFGIPGYWGWPYAYGYPYAYPAPYPAYAPSYAPSEPSTYIEESAHAPQASEPIYWYYCTDPRGYYPYVQNCTKPWVQVLPQSVSGGQNAPAPAH